MSQQDNFVPPPPPNPPPLGNPMYSPEVLRAKTAEAESDAKNALIMSIVGIFCLGLILGILSFKKANNAIHTIDTYGVAPEKRGIAMAAKILSILDIIGWVFVIIGNIALRS